MAAVALVELSLSRQSVNGHWEGNLFLGIGAGPRLDLSLEGTAPLPAVPGALTSTNLTSNVTEEPRKYAASYLAFNSTTSSCSKPCKTLGSVPKSHFRSHKQSGFEDAIAAIGVGRSGAGCGCCGSGCWLRASWMSAGGGGPGGVRAPGGGPGGGRGAPGGGRESGGWTPGGGRVGGIFTAH